MPRVYYILCVLRRVRVCFVCVQKTDELTFRARSRSRDVGDEHRAARHLSPKKRTKYSLTASMSAIVRFTISTPKA